MASLEKEIQQSKFENERIKANINLLFTANWLHYKITLYLKKFKISHEQFNVLRILRGSHPKGMSQKDILSRMIAPNSNLTLIINKLKVKKLIDVQQSEIDGREYVIHISPNGLLLLKQIDKAFDPLKNNFNPLTNKEAFHLNALLDKLRTE